jgi:hypothetical protein
MSILKDGRYRPADSTSAGGISQNISFLVVSGTVKSSNVDLKYLASKINVDQGAIYLPLFLRPLVMEHLQYQNNVR